MVLANKKYFANGIIDIFIVPLLYKDVKDKREHSDDKT